MRQLNFNSVQPISRTRKTIKFRLMVLWEAFDSNKIVFYVKQHYSWYSIYTSYKTVSDDSKSIYIN